MSIHTMNFLVFPDDQFSPLSHHLLETVRHKGKDLPGCQVSPASGPQMTLRTSARRMLIEMRKTPQKR